MITQKGAVYLAWMIFWDHVLNPNKKPEFQSDELTW